MLYGGDYNPDQWPEVVWEEDVRLMREAGVNLVSVAIFSWSRLEPAQGRYDFAWLDRVLDLLHRGGIAVDLATGTASPPPWLVRRHPEMLPVLADGVRLHQGARQHYCPSSPAYRDAARRLAEAMATHYGDHPALAMWHVGNEYGCHVPACWCDVSAADFRAWLQGRYGTIEELNRAWGTDFWSQRYSDWEEVIPPRRTPTWPNPTQSLDFQRFSSDALLECYEAERRELLEHTPGVPITTNFMSFFKPLDYWKWAEHEDIVSNDAYPDPADPDSGLIAALNSDLMRSLARGRPWIQMEQTTNRVNWRPVNAAKPPGLMRLWCLQQVARGADGVLFFQWRQSRAGAEKWHSAMLPHGAPEHSHAWLEAKALGADLAKLDAVCGSRVGAEVAIVFDWESWWALELPSKPSGEVRQLDQLRAYYRHLFDGNVAVDFARSTDDLARYRLVLVPNLYLLSDQAAANLNAYVEAGGTLVMSFFSGIVDPDDHVRLGGYPAPFRELLGLRVEDFLPLSAGQELSVAFADGTRGTGDLWSELVTPDGAEELASFDGGVLAARPAVTRNRFGKGTAYYLATRLDSASMARLLAEAQAEAGVRPTWTGPAGVEAVRRDSPRGRFLFLLNHSEAEVEVPVAEGSDELLSGKRTASSSLTLPPRGVAILVEPGGAP